MHIGSDVNDNRMVFFLCEFLLYVLANPNFQTINPLFFFQVLLLLLLSIPKALSKRAEFEVPLSPPLFSLLFYLMCLMLCALHVIVCTSAESLCYFCSMSWLTAVGVMMLISALMCGILSAIAKIFENSRLPPKVRACVNYGSKCFIFHNTIS